MADHFSKGVTSSNEQLDGSSLRILIIHTRWNLPIVQGLVKGATDTLTTKFKVNPDNIAIQSVPGAYELPFAAGSLIRAASQQKLPFDAVIPIGVLIKGSTMHFEYICEAVTHGIMRVGLDLGVPVIFGVLTCLTDEQALVRAGMGGKDGREGHNHGVDWAAAAVEMALLKYKTF